MLECASFWLFLLVCEFILGWDMSNLQVLLSFVLLLALPGSAQSTTSTTYAPTGTASTNDPQAALLINEAELALMGSTVFSDIQLNTSSAWSAGATQASGTTVLKSKGTGEARLDISAGQFARSEIRNDSSGPNGQWLDAAGVRHPSAVHNCWQPAGWFSPHALVQLLSATDSVVSYLGSEMRGSITVDHLRAYRNYNSNSVKINSDIQLLSTFDVYLDSSTHLPIAVTFNTHPDNDYGRNVPVEVRFADYRSVNGVEVPFHIQRLLQGVLNLDLTVTSATVNSGLSDSDFALQ